MPDYSNMADDLTELLSLSHPPLAITFRDSHPAGIERYRSEYPPKTEDGRTGAVSAGCVFWAEASDQTFATLPEDHGNCSVGSLTHGMIGLEEAAARGDVQALCEAKWVSPEIFPRIATVQSKPAAVIYGPLAETPVDPDIVFLRLNAKQAMQLHAAVPSLQFEGKPQCHIIAVAKERRKPAISVGCMLSRVRTGFASSEMTCALPVDQAPGIIEDLRASTRADRLVAGYASEDAARFRETA